jgi:phage terminase large subunit
MDVSIDYEPRSAFIPFHQRDDRWAAMCCHRRAGKTVACIHELLIRALYTKKKRAKFAYVGPFRQQAKEIAWEYLKDATKGVRKGNPRESELKITLPNDATIQLYGADNPDSLRGLYFDGVVMDEYGDCRPSIWGEVVLPTLLDRDGWAVFIGTMRGKNHFYQLLERAKKEPGWFNMTLKADTSGILSHSSLEQARLEMTEEQWQQEMLCNPDAAVQGTYYANLIAKIEKDGQVGDFPFDPNELVHVSADIGYTDSTAFWFWQLTPEGPILIDYYEADGKPVEHYFEVLDDKPYKYAELWLPHDAKATSFQTGRSTVEQFLQKGYPCKVVPKLAVQHGIDAARLILPQVRFNLSTCYAGIEALRAYRRSWNEKVQAFAEKPLHDWASNGADSFRYFSLVTETEMVEPSIEATTSFEPEPYCLEDLWAEKDKWREGVIRL